jgi:tRNA U34 5-carboxymethylaminomethyl modifying enzyme MnmG/GidA
MSFSEHFDPAAVGAAHAGCEATMASVRMGLRTAGVDLLGHGGVQLRLFDSAAWRLCDFGDGKGRRAEGRISS